MEVNNQKIPLMNRTRPSGTAVPEKGQQRICGLGQQNGPEGLAHRSVQSGLGWKHELPPQQEKQILQTDKLHRWINGTKNG